MTYQPGGRGRGGRFGRGGRGQGRFYNNNKAKFQNNSGGPGSSKSAELKFAPQGNGKGPVATYNSVKEAIISHIQKSYTNGQDVAKSLKAMVKVDLQAMEP